MEILKVIKSILSSPQFWGIMVPALIAVWTFYKTENNKLKWEQYKSKEQSYTSLIKSVKGFYVGSHDDSLKNMFIEQLNLCWLYAPDEVIQHGYKFLMSVHTGKVYSDEEKELALGNFIAVIRKDMLDQKITRKTNLKGDDYKHLKSNTTLNK